MDHFWHHRFISLPGSPTRISCEKVRVLVSRLGSGVDVTPLFQFRERQACINRLPLVEHLVDIAVDDHPPVKPGIGVVGHGMLADAGGAVFGQGVVPLGPLLEPVDLPQVTEENLAGELRS